jgi:hypothetical protein
VSAKFKTKAKSSARSAYLFSFWTETNRTCLKAIVTPVRAELPPLIALDFKRQSKHGVEHLPIQREVSMVCNKEHPLAAKFS